MRCLHLVPLLRDRFRSLSLTVAFFYLFHPTSQRLDGNFFSVRLPEFLSPPRWPLSPRRFFATPWSHHSPLLSSSVLLPRVLLPSLLVLLNFSVTCGPFFAGQCPSFMQGLSFLPVWLLSLSVVGVLCGWNPVDPWSCDRQRLWLGTPSTNYSCLLSSLRTMRNPSWIDGEVQYDLLPIATLWHQLFRIPLFEEKSSIIHMLTFRIPSIPGIRFSSRQLLLGYS